MADFQGNCLCIYSKEFISSQLCCYSSLSVAYLTKLWSEVKCLFWDTVYIKNTACI